MFFTKSHFIGQPQADIIAAKKMCVLFVCKITLLSRPLFPKRTEKCPYTLKFSFKPFIYVAKGRYNCAKVLMAEFGQIYISLMANFWKKYATALREVCFFRKYRKKFTTHPLEYFGTFFFPINHYTVKGFCFFQYLPLICFLKEYLLIFEI